MAKIHGQLHPENSATDDFYPNIEAENIPNNSIDGTKVTNAIPHLTSVPSSSDNGKVVKVSPTGGWVLSTESVTSVNGLKGAVTIDKFDLGLPTVAITGDYNDLENKPTQWVTSVNGLTGAVTIDKFDLGLPQVALTGSYNDLLDKPAPAAVTSVNGLTGAVTIDVFDLGLGWVDSAKPTTDDVGKYLKATAAGVAEWEEVAGGGGGGGVTSVNGMTGAVTIDKFDLGLPQVALTGSYNDLEDLPNISWINNVNPTTADVGKYLKATAAGVAEWEEVAGGGGGGGVTSVNGLTGAVTIDAYDLGLGWVDSVKPTNSDVGKYLKATANGTAEWEEVAGGGGGGGVTSVNGLTGAVTIDKYDIGLGKVANTNQMPLTDSIRFGANFNSLTNTGFYYVQGTSDLPCTNAPTSPSNTMSNCKWFVLVGNMNNAGTNIVQIAFSALSDTAIRMRAKVGSSWGSWVVIA